MIQVNSPKGFKRLFYLVFFYFPPTDTTCQYNLYRYYVVYMLLFHCYCYLLSCIHCTHKFLGTFCTLVMWNKLKLKLNSGFKKKNPGIHFYSGVREKKTQGGGVQLEILRNPGIDFYSGFRKKIQVYTFIVASEKKNTRGGVQFEILKNPGIDFYSGFRTKIQVCTFIVASEKKKHKGGCNSKS